jgi:hypothetical protein
MNDSGAAPRLSVVVLSCDAYADAWPPFFTLLERFWPDCPYTVYLVSETLGFDHPRVKVLTPGQLMPWSDRLKWALEKIASSHVLLLLEDYLLLKVVDQARVASYFEWLVAQGGAYLRLIPVPEPPRALAADATLGELPVGTSYRTSTQAAIWKKGVLHSLLIPNETAWSFERDSVARSSHISGFYSLTLDAMGHPYERGSYPMVYYCTAINKGKWRAEAIRQFELLGVYIDTSKRGVEPTKIAVTHWFARLLTQLRYRLTGRYELRDIDAGRA